MVNRRFGLGTWEDIMMERQERLDKAKTRQQKEREKKKEQIDKWFEYTKNGIITVLVVLGMFIMFMFYTEKWTL
jgi:quinol-cytochrome oxidoreductase complex cytochrome b subunit